MTYHSSLVFSGIAPHPPIMVPEVGPEAVGEVRESAAAMAELTKRIICSGAESIILISPHAPLEADSFVAYQDPELYGDFSHFRAPETRFSVSLDAEILAAIRNSAGSVNYRITGISEHDLDHGIAVPLYFLLKHGWQGRVVALGYSFLANEDHLRFGSCIRKAVDQVGRRTAFIASGDLSHRLKPQAPAGYNPGAHAFDEQVVDNLRSSAPQRIVEIDQDMRAQAGECGYRSILVAIGAGRKLPLACEVISYEAPFGVGYMVAQLTNSSTEEAAYGFFDKEDAAVDLAALAREAVETFVHTGDQTSPPLDIRGLLAARAPCFVSLKTLTGDLRGCMGTIEPVKDTLAQEIIANAISAATHDPRFPPVRDEELSNLRYSVDVLLPSEPAVMDELDPLIYGVIVEDESGSRRGLLLPDIPGVESAEEQVEIAARKAGIPRGAPLKLSRFKVERFRETFNSIPDEFF
jgi:AmmeMemoRadiSam system protein A/AmmeMemoRadiSam system protein B